MRSLLLLIVLTLTFSLVYTTENSWAVNTESSESLLSQNVELANPNRDDLVPEVVIRPNALELDLLTGELDEEVINITNEGDAPVDFGWEVGVFTPELQFTVQTTLSPLM